MDACILPPSLVTILTFSDSVAYTYITHEAMQKLFNAILKMLRVKHRNKYALGRLYFSIL